MIYNFVEILRQEPALYISLVGVFSLLIGSFLNVVIIRLPKTLKQIWRKECFEFLELANTDDKSKPYNLIFPRSHCVKCKSPIRVIDNIPVISFIMLRGRCHFCHDKISWRYPIIESLSAILCMMIAWKFGPSWQAIAGFLLTYVLIVQSCIDLDHQIIPDEITLPMIWIGLIFGLYGIFNNIESCLFGAVFGYLILWLTFWIFYFITKKEGMGYGDFKLLAMIGAWFGWQALPFNILFSSLIGSIVSLTFIVLTKKSTNTRIPFGPFLAASAWIYLMYGPQINKWYLSLSYSGIY